MSFKLYGNVLFLITITQIIMTSHRIQCHAKDGIQNAQDIPNFCNFPDTINITDGTVRDCMCKSKTCVRSCCPFGHAYRSHTVGLDHCDSEFNSNLTEMKIKVLHGFKIDEIDLYKYGNKMILTGNSCRSGYFLNPNDPSVDDQWTILSNGSLLRGKYEANASVVQQNNYCLAHVKNISSTKFSISAMICTDNSNQDMQQILGWIIYPIGMLVSVIFLSLTLFVYLWIEELRQTILGKNLMCYLATLIIAYSLLTFTNIDKSHAVNGKVKCLILAELIHTTFICGFLWLGIISYDIWRTIGRTTDNNQNQFLHYCFFVLGGTFFIVFITNVLDHVDWLKDNLRPGLGKDTCWLQESTFARFLYLYAIIIIIITINSVFFILTKITIKRISYRATNSEDSRKFTREETDADRLGLSLRLFIIMGIQWIIEILSWILNAENIFTYILDIITMLQGPFIFFLFIVKRRVLNLIKHKFGFQNV